MSSIYYTSDLHIGHQFVSDIRGFATTDEHDAVLAERWRSTVTKRDVVYVLGDLTLRNPARLVAYMNELPGTKYLIYGNHDAGHPMHRGWEGKQAVYAEMFRATAPFARRKIGGRTVLLSHFPYAHDRDIEPRYMQYRLRDEGEWLLHGHTHSTDRTYTHPREIHVGMDAWAMTPVPEVEIVRLIEQQEKAEWTTTASAPVG